MSDADKEAMVNLEFFKSAVLDPALRQQRLVGPDGERTVSQFGAIEAAHWAWLGAKIGYFNGKDAQELISSSAGVFAAWSNLQNRQIISPKDQWANVIQPSESGELKLNEKVFTGAVEIASDTRAWLQNTYQTFLLLTAENILENDSRYFLDTSGWTDPLEWRARRSGIDSGSLLGWVQRIESGFANVLDYLEEMDSASHSTKNWQSVSEQSDIWRWNWDIGMNFSEGFAREDVVSQFTQDARAIVGRRFNLGDSEIVTRYYALAGDLANRAKDNSPAWLDARVRFLKS